MAQAKGILSVLISTLALGACATAPAAIAAADIDCPLRDAVYSVDTPVMDILLKPEAVAAIERVIPGFPSAVPQTFLSATPPSFSAIINLRIAQGMGMAAGADLHALDSSLRALPITDADRSARCARYDYDSPDLAFPSTGVRVLLFEKMTGFRDGPSVDAAHAAFTAMAERRGWTLRSTTSGGAINSATLANVDVIIWNNVSGDVLTLRQRAALQDYIEGGGGFLAVHGSGGDPIYLWDWYVDTLIGARFIGHPMNPQFQQAQVLVPGDAHSGIGRDLAPGWSMTDEWYSFASNPRTNGATIIASLDESSYAPGELMGRRLSMGEHPIAWAHCVGDGRSFYSAIGHMPETYAEPHNVSLLEQATTWAAGEGATVCRNGQEVAR